MVSHARSAHAYHVRVYSGLPAGGQTAGIFFTRWITHFWAPAFVFLAGTSAFLYGQRHSDLPRFLVTRGLWLVALELTVIRVMWTFNFQFGEYILAGVIWVVGWSMILMSGLVRLPVSVVGAIGLVIVAGHNMLDSRFWQLAESLETNQWAGLWKIMYFSFFAGPVTIGADGPRLTVLYSIVPWVGVMAAGYAFGTVVVADPARRRRLCFGIGLTAIALVLVLRGLNLYGDPNTWGGAAEDGRPAMPALFAFLNTSKYPASLLFLLMTLGRVPFFFYILHIPLIHVLAMAVSRVTLGSVSPWLFANHPRGNPPAPEGYAWSLGTLYLVWVVAVGLLYFPCRWFAELKARRNDRWLSYL